MRAADYFLNTVGRRLILAASIGVAFAGLFTVVYLIDLVFGYNALNATIFIGNSEIDLIVPIGLAGVVIAALLYLRLMGWLQQAIRLEEEQIELRLRD